MADVGTPTAGYKSKTAGDGDLTILLMLKDRASFTFRWMSYADSVTFPFKVFVADGGSDDAVERVLTDRGNYPHVDFTYVRYPPDESYAHFYAKLDDALSRIDTPLVALSDNDDFWIVDGTRESARFLRAHPDYVTCGGQMAYFWVNASGSAHPVHSLYGNRVAWKISRVPEPSTEGTASARIRVPYDVYYHVHRTAELRRHFRIIRDANPQDIFMVDFMVFLLTAIAGPSKTLDVLYLARQNDSPGSAAAAHQEQHGDWFGRMFQPFWSDDITHLVRVVSAALADADAIPLDEARTRILDWLRTSFGRDVLTTLVRDRKVTPLPVLMSCLVPALLARIRRDSTLWDVARGTYRRLRWISPEAVQGTEWRSRPVAQAAEAFKQVQDFLARGAPHPTP